MPRPDRLSLRLVAVGPQGSGKTVVLQALEDFINRKFLVTTPGLIRDGYRGGSSGNPGEMLDITIQAPDEQTIKTMKGL